MSGGAGLLARGAWSVLGGVAAVAVGAWSLSTTDPAARVADTEAAVIVAGVVEQRSIGGDLSAASTAGLAVVKVSVSACGSRSTGSGFVVADGVVLTAAHVIGDAGLVRVDLESRIVTGEVIGRFADGRDIAVIEIDTGELPVPAEGTVPPLGEPLTIVGHPGGGPRTVSVGLRVEPLPSTTDVVITRGHLIGLAAPSGLGFSGGPAVDSTGGLVGMVVAAEVGTGTTIVVPVEAPSGGAGFDLVPNTCTSAA